MSRPATSIFYLFPRRVPMNIMNVAETLMRILHTHLAPQQVHFNFNLHHAHTHLPHHTPPHSRVSTRALDSSHTIMCTRETQEQEYMTT